MVGMNLEWNGWFRKYGPMMYPLGSPLGGAILCILPVRHFTYKPKFGL